MNTQRDINALSEQSNLNLGGKVFLTALSAWIVGKKVNTKIRGTSQEIKVITSTLLASKHLHDELNKSNATVKSVVQKIHQKQKHVAEFERLFGLKWPL